MLLTRIDVNVKKKIESKWPRKNKSAKSSFLAIKWFSSWRQTKFLLFFSRERREAEQRERQEKERRERERQERERAERERREREQKSAVEAVDHHFQLSIELAKKVLIIFVRNFEKPSMTTTFVEIEKLDQT